jgi:hypothetical protein
MEEELLVRTIDIQGSEAVHYVDAEGTYLGGFADCDPPEGGIAVPTAPAHALQKWLGDDWGPIPVQVPSEVTAAQARVALIRAGVYEQVKAALAAQASFMPEVLVWFEYATVWRRDNPNITALGTGLLGMTESEIDELFILAASIDA